MMLLNQSEARTTPMPQESGEKTVSSPDPSWKGLYKAGSITTFLYLALAIAVPVVQVFTMQYDFKLGGRPMLEFIAENKGWWLFLQTMVLGTSILAIVSFAALYVALKHLDKSMALLGAIVTITCQLLFMAYYPVLLGLIYLSDQFAAAPAGQQAIFTTAAESLIAMNNGFNPLYESLFGAGILFFSLVMLKGVFHKSIGYLGMATCVIVITALSLWSVIGLGYFWWWVFFAAWFSVVGWKLWRLGQA